MKSDNKYDSKILEDDIDKLSKNLYLESPDLWIDFTDKINDNKFDEMILFFASKYNFLSIIKHAITNELIDVSLPSKNKSYPTISQHIISVAQQNNNAEIYDYLKGLRDNEDSLNCKKSDDKIKNDNIDNNNKDNNISYYPKFICKNCKTNIFDTGFSECEKIIYTYSPEENSIKETSRARMNKISCSNCNTQLDNVTLEILESLCSIQNCSKCFTNLTIGGITDKVKMIFDDKINKFIPQSTTYHCSNCDNIINENQKIFFGL